MRTQTPQGRSLGSDLLHEGLGAAEMAFRAVYHMLQCAPRTEEDGRNELIIPGFQAPASTYLSIARWMQRKNPGTRVHIFDWGFLSWRSYHRPFAEIVSFVEKFQREVGPIRSILGHSMGGVEAVGLLPHFPNIERVVAVCSPFCSGTTWPIIKAGSYVLPVPDSMHPKNLRQIVEDGRPHAEKITTVGVCFDRLVPPNHAVYPASAAHNIVITEREAATWTKKPRTRGIERRSLTHTGILHSPAFRRKILAPILA